MIEEGQTAPDFNLATDGDGSIKLSNFKSQAVVIYFYPKDDTSGCTKEAIAFSEHAHEFANLNVLVVGISPDSVTSHNKFKAKHNLSIILASDPEKIVAQAYGVWIEKIMYGRTYMGIERSTFLVAPDGKLAKIWRKVKVPGHTEAVLEAAKAVAAH